MQQKNHIVPWQNASEWNEIGLFFRRVDRAHQGDFNRVRKTVKTIFTLYESLSGPMDELCALTCPDCRDSCCKRATVWYDFKDLVFFFYAFGRMPESQVCKIPLENQGTGCCHLACRGCRLLRQQRPFICSWYICAAQSRLIQAHPLEYRQVPEIVAQIKTFRNSMESEFCRVSALAPVHRTTAVV